MIGGSSSFAVVDDAGQSVYCAITKNTRQDAPLAATDADPRPLSILLVEDEAAHAELVLRTLEGRSEEVEIVYVSDGEATVDVLRTLGAERDVRNAYDAHANGYVVKPEGASRFS